MPAVSLALIPVFVEAISLMQDNKSSSHGTSPVDLSPFLYICYTVLIFVIAFLCFYLKHQNAKRDRLQTELRGVGASVVIDVKMVHAFDDLTDKENANFRYVY